MRIFSISIGFVIIMAVLYFLPNETDVNMPVTEDIETGSKFYLEDFYADNAELSEKVDKIYNQLSNRQKAAQMVVVAAGRLGKADTTVANLVQKEAIGGVLLLNGNKESFLNYVDKFNRLAKTAGHLPLLYSADAEPSLINRKISDSAKVPKTADLRDEAHSAEIALTIANELTALGIRHNYAPVSDISPDNEAIRNRSYGNDPQRVINLSKAFIDATQKSQIAATVKHFPGHGMVKGDSHNKLVYIDGPLREIQVFDSLSKSGAISIMAGHIAVQNNTEYDTKGLPASCSPVIINGLLKEKLGFKGIVVTDAMNMGAVASLTDAPLLAAKAGCDIILMPNNERKLISQIEAEMALNDDFGKQATESIKKIIRLKICLGLL
ncbi:MAG: glycoside hydrolase family 3 N-terminal domain-containing protein [Cyclobacteriaceae bacterium]